MSKNDKNKCDFCGQKPSTKASGRYHTGGRMDVVHEVTSFLFKCHRCGGYFCGDHRLPEQHECIGNVSDDSYQTINIPMKDDYTFMIKNERNDLEKKKRLPLYNDIYLRDNEDDKNLGENYINPPQKKKLPLYNDVYRPNVVGKSVSTNSKSFIGTFGKSLVLLCISAILLFLVYGAIR